MRNKTIQEEMRIFNLKNMIKCADQNGLHLICSSRLDRYRKVKKMDMQTGTLVACNV